MNAVAAFNLWFRKILLSTIESKQEFKRVSRSYDEPVKDRVKVGRYSSVEQMSTLYNSGPR